MIDMLIETLGAFFAAGVLGFGAGIVASRVRRARAARTSLAKAVSEVGTRPAAVRSPRSPRAAAAAAVATVELASGKAPSFPADPRSSDDLRRRIVELEEQLQATVERLGRRTTEIRNLEARVRHLDPLVASGMTALRSVTEERDRAQAALRDAQTELSVLRDEIEWRDYVIRDLEPVAERLDDARRDARSRETALAKQLAARDAEVLRLRAALAESRKASAVPATSEEVTVETLVAA